MLSKDEIKKLISEKYTKADVSGNSVGESRDKAIKYYRGDLYGDEHNGKSQVVTREVFEAVETIVPQLTDVFLASDAPVVFVPKNAQDVIPAELETKYVNHVLMEKNDGFNLIATAIQDAVLQKNCVVEAYWDEVVDVEKETYESLPPEQFAVIVSESEASNFELEDLSMNEDGTYNVTINKTKQNGQIKIENVPPEDFRVTLSHNSVVLQGADYCARALRVNTYDLIADGHSPEDVKRLQTYDEANERDKDEIPYDDDAGSTDCRIVEVVKHYIRADFDGSGEVKLWYVLTGSGAGLNVVLDVKEADTIPFFSGVIMRNPHRFYGTSIADVVMGIQRINSNLLRQMLDNVYLANSPTRLVDTDRVKNPSALADGGAGKTIGVRGDPTTAVRDLSVPFFANHGFLFFEHFKSTLEKRTGTSEMAQGLDPDALADSTNLVGSMVMNAALVRVKYMARTFGETLLKPLMLHIHELTRKHEASNVAFLVDGEFVDIDPRTWSKRNSMSVRVGLGYTEKRERVAQLSAILANQKEIWSATQGSGLLVTPQNIYDNLLDIGRAAGFPEVTKYFTPPEQFQPPEPQPDPMEGQLQVLQMQIMAEMEQTKARLQADAMKNAEKLAQERHEFEQKMKAEWQKIDDAYKVNMEKIEQQYRANQQQAPIEVQSGGA